MFLIVGGDSEIGAAAYRAMKAQGKAVAATTRRRDRVAPDRPFLDLAAPLDAWEPPPGTQAVCLCAAIARLAACAADPEGSAHINVGADPGADREALGARHRRAVPLDQPGVRRPHAARAGRCAAFAGERIRPPEGAHRSGAAAISMESGAPVAILRLAKVVSDTMPLIGGWIKDLTAAKPIRVFNDLTLAPTPTDLVCTAIARLAARSRPRHLSAHRAARRHLCRYRRAFSPPISAPIQNSSIETSARDGRAAGGRDAAEYHA